MGNSNSAQPLDYQVESSERVTLYGTTFEKLDGDSEHHLPHQNGVFYRYSIEFTFSVNNDTELLKGIFTREKIYENVVIGQLFPVKRTSELKSGIFEELGEFEPGTFYKHSIELYVPKNLAERRTCGFILDSDNIVVAKARGVIAMEDEFQLNESLETRIPVERKSRAQGLLRMSKIELEKRVQNALEGLTDAVQSLSMINKSRVEFIEASDSIKLAYRAYHSNKGPPVAICIIIASNSHFHDIIVSGLAHNHPITAYVLEMRGYGYSGGPRGDAPFKEQVWTDVQTFVRYIRMNSGSMPIFLAGHYYQAGLVLNYSSWKDREPVDGYLFISPNFGYTAAEAQNQEAIERVYKTMDSYGLSAFASSIFGNRAAVGNQRFLLSDFEHEINPLIVDLASINITKACTSFAPKKQFETIDCPFGVWIGEKEEFLHTEKVIQYPRQGKVHSSINVLPGFTHMGVLTHVSQYIGDWIMTLDAVKKSHLADEIFDIVAADDYSPTNNDSLLKDLDLLMANYVKLGLRNSGKYSYLIANDGTQIRYQLFQPQDQAKAKANLVLVQADIKVVFAWILANKYDVAVYLMDLRGIDNASVVATKESILSDIRTVVRHLRCNDAEMPILLGGHGYGASVALNYSSWINKEAINGYLIVSPVIDHHSPFSRDLQMVNARNMERLFAINETKSWFSQFRRSYSYSVSVPPLSKLRRSTSSDSASCESRKEKVEISTILWETITCRNVTQLLGHIDVPFGLWIGDEDELVSGNRLIQLASEVAPKLPLREIQLINHSSHYANLITSTAFIGPFIRKFAKIIAPSLIFTLRNPRLEMFERLQFIGRGSFGRVYLVRHRSSEKYFAMKVLRKKDILDANEVTHVISERNILRDLNSSFVVSYVGSFQDTHHLYIIMDYVIGGELFTQLGLRKRLSNEAAKFYAAEVVLFFEDIHSKNIAYRDLKPENILIDAMGHIKITDFGFAKYLWNRKTNTFCGTPQYIAPEIIISAELGKKSTGYGFSADIYSLGVLIYEMLVGQTPFNDSNVRAIYRRVLYGNVEFPWGLDNSAKDLIRSLLMRSVNKRLGCAPGQSLEDIKRHRWFKGIDWDQLRRREVPPPFVPKFSHAGDTSNFIPWGKDKQTTPAEYDYGNAFVNF